MAFFGDLEKSRPWNFSSRQVENAISTWFHLQSVREPLIKSEVPAVQGRAAIIKNCKFLIMKQGANRICAAACSDKSGTDLFRASNGQPLIKSEVPAVQGRAAIIKNCKFLIMKQGANRICAAACSDKSGTDLFRASNGQSLIKSEVPAVQGRAAIIKNCKFLIMKQGANRICAAVCSDKSGTDLFRAS